MRTRSFLLLFTALWCTARVSTGAEQTFTVFAAASLTEVLEAAAEAYRSRTGIPVRISFAASSALARQIESGAPADVFISADEAWMDYLAARKLIRTEGRLDIASNTLVLVAPISGSLNLRIAPGFPLARALGPRGRLALADPASVPAGKYAQAALMHLGVWASVADRLIPADNVRTALNFVSLGEAPAGIVYETDARNNNRVRVVDRFPAGSHDPIRYPAAATVKGGPAADGFVRFLLDPQVQEIFRKAGFGRP